MSANKSFQNKNGKLCLIFPGGFFFSFPNMTTNIVYYIPCKSPLVY